MVFVIHWHESAMDLHVFPIRIPPPTSLFTRSLWAFPVHQAQAPVSCIQAGLVICFTLDNIHASMLFSQNIPSSSGCKDFHLQCGRSCFDLWLRKISWRRELYTDVQDRLLDSVGEGEGGMFWENSNFLRLRDWLIKGHHTTKKMKMKDQRLNTQDT